LSPPAANVGIFTIQMARQNRRCRVSLDHVLRVDAAAADGIPVIPLSGIV
jgi:hypothetical protein